MRLDQIDAARVCRRTRAAGRKAGWQCVCFDGWCRTCSAIASTGRNRHAKAKSLPHHVHPRGHVAQCLRRGERTMRFAGLQDDAIRSNFYFRSPALAVARHRCRLERDPSQRAKRLGECRLSETRQL
jgi:hypothetical protein